jgi:hypothetical protein
VIWKQNEIKDMITDSENNDMGKDEYAWTRSGCGLDVYRRDGVVTMTDSLIFIPSFSKTQQQSMPNTDSVLLPFCPIFSPFRAPSTCGEENRLPCLRLSSQAWVSAVVLGPLDAGSRGQRMRF